jgi:hypothetical protein
MKIGDRVTFRPSHQTDLLLTGTLVGCDDVNHLQVEADAQNGSMAKTYDTHASTVTLLEDPAPAAEAAKPQVSEDEPAVAAEQIPAASE